MNATYMNDKLSIITNDRNNSIIVVVNQKEEFYLKDFNYLTMFLNKFIRDKYGSKRS